MGTRGSMGWRIDGEDKLGYRQFDSYPDGGGIDVLEHAREFTDPKTRETYEAAIRELELVSQQDEPTEEQQRQLRSLGITPQNVSTGSDWYAWLREFQDNLAGYLGVGYMPDAAGFVNDSLFCEWAYVINLDDNVLEVYEGFQQQRGEGRYADALEEPPTKEEYQTAAYWPVALITTFPLDDLPTDEDFVTQVNKASER